MCIYVRGHTGQRRGVAITCSKDTWLLTSTAILCGFTRTTWRIHGAYGVLAGRLHMVPRCSPVPATQCVGPHVVQEHPWHQRRSSGTHDDVATLCMVCIRRAAGLRLQFLSQTSNNIYLEATTTTSHPRQRPRQ